MLEFLAYGLFAVCVIGCLAYVMSALETEEPPSEEKDSSASNS
jgi:hypothetical protein